MTLLFSRLIEVVEIHVHAKFHQAKFSGSSIIVLTEREAENNTAVASAGSKIHSKIKSARANMPLTGDNSF